MIRPCFDNFFAVQFYSVPEYDPLEYEEQILKSCAERKWLETHRKHPDSMTEMHVYDFQNRPDNIDHDGWWAFAMKMIKEDRLCSKIQRLVLGRCVLYPKDVAVLYQAIRGKSSLTRLQLTNCWFSDGSELAWICHSLPNLESFCADDKGTVGVVGPPTDMNGLLNELNSTHLPKLKRFVLELRHHTSLGTPILRLLDANFLHQMERLHLDECELSFVQIKEILSRIRNDAQIKFIHLHCLDWGQDDVLYEMNRLVRHLPRLESITFSLNELNIYLNLEAQGRMIASVLLSNETFYHAHKEMIWTYQSQENAWHQALKEDYFKVGKRLVNLGLKIYALLCEPSLVLEAVVIPSYRNMLQ